MYPKVLMRLVPYYLFNRLQEASKASLISPYTGSYAEQGADMRYPLPTYNLTDRDTFLQDLDKIREYLEMLEMIKQLECPYLNQHGRLIVAEAILEEQKYNDRSKYTPDLFAGLTDINFDDEDDDFDDDDDDDHHY